jgi:hypothetical protein
MHTLFIHIPFDVCNIYFQHVKGVDYLGLGYNLAYGNPSGDPLTQIDPGFKAPVAELLWDGDVTTRDRKQLSPVGGYAYPEKSCYRAQTAVSTSSMSDYSSSLSTDCSVSASVGYSGWGVDASASFSYSEAAKCL